MIEQLCPVCGCTVSDKGYDKDGVTYCCESCASSSTSSCECGCCHPADESHK